MPLEQAFVAANKGYHYLKAFDCGKPTMNTFLSKFAEKHGNMALAAPICCRKSPKLEKYPSQRILR